MNGNDQSRPNTTWLKIESIPLVLCAALGIVLAGLAWYALQGEDERKLREELSQHARTHAGAFRMVLADYLVPLDAVVAFRGATSQFDRTTYRTYVRPLQSSRSGLSSIDWIPRVRDKERGDFEKSMRGEGFRDFRIRDRKQQGEMIPAPNRSEYFPVQYQVPIPSDGIALGYDLGSNPTRLEALRRACDSGTRVATSRIVLVEETDPSLFSVLVCQPVYRSSAATVEARRERLLGFAIAVVRVRDVLEVSLAGLPSQDLDLTLYDTSSADDEQLLYQHRADSGERSVPPTPKRNRHTQIEEVEVGGRKWAFVVEPTAAYLSGHRNRSSWIASAGVLGCTLLLCAYLNGMRKKKERIERQVAERTQQLSMANRTLEAGQLRLRKQVEMLGQLTHGELHKGSDLLPLLERITEQVSRTIGVARVSVWRYSPEPDSICCECLFDESSGRHSSGVVLQALQFPEYFAALKTSCAIAADDARFDPRTREFTQNYLVPLGITSMLDTPISRSGRLEGVLCLEHVGPARDWLPDEQTFGIAVARHVSLLLEKRERLLAEKRLRRSEERFRLVWDHSAEGMCLTDESGTVQQVNRALCGLFELPEERIVGQPVTALHEGKLEGETELRLAGGKKVWFEIERCDLPPIPGQPRLHLTIYRDVTARKRQTLLMEQTHRAAQVGGWELDLVTNHLSWTEETYRIHEVTPEQYTPTLETATAFYTAEHASIVADAIRNAQERGESWEFEVELDTARGNRIWAHAIGKVELQDGRAVRAYGSFQDITERKRAELALAKAQANLAAVLENTRDAVWSVDGRLRLVTCNAAYVELHDLVFGQRPKLGQELAERIPEPAGLGDRIRRLYESALQGVSVRDEFSFAVGRCFDISFYPIRTAEGIAGVAVFARDVTERKRAELALRETASQLRGAMTLGCMGSYQWDLASNRSIWSPELYAIYGLSAESEITFESYLACIHPDHRDQVTQTIAQSMHSHLPFCHQYRIVRPTGEVRWVMARGECVRDVAGAVSGLQGVCQDITEQKVAEESIRRLNEELEARVAERTAELRAANDQLALEVIERRKAEQAVGKVSAFREAIIGTAAEGICVGHFTDDWPHLRFSVWNDRLTEITGYTKEEMNSSGWCETISPDEEGQLLGRRRMHEVRTGQDVAGQEWLIRHKDGSLRTVSISTSRIDSDGTEAVVTLVQDVTQRKRAELALLHSEKKYRDLVETSHNLIWSVDASGRWTFLNRPAALAIFGYEPEEMLGRPFTDFMSEDQAHKDLTIFSRLMNGQSVFDYETEQIRKDGKRVILSYNAIPLLSEDGQFAGTTGSATDITAYKRAETELREKELRLRQMAEASDQVFWLRGLSPEEILYVSPAFEAVWGRAVDDLYWDGQLWTACIHPDDVSPTRKAFDDWLAGQRPDFDVEYRIVRPDGAVRWIHDRGVVIRNDRDEPYRASGVACDITEYRAAQHQLAQRARLMEFGASVGLALARGGELREALQHCTSALVQHLDGAFARIWTLNDRDNVLELRASAGIYTHTDGEHARIPVGLYKIGRIAAERLPHLTNDVQHDPRISDPAWAIRERMVGFAGYPLEVEGRVVGVMAMFARQPLDQAALDAMCWVSVGIAQAIQRKRTQEALEASEQRYRAFVAHSTEGIWRFEVEPPISTDLPVHDQAHLYLARAYLAECNNAMAQMYGYSDPSPLIGKRFRDFLLPTDTRVLDRVELFVRNDYRVIDSETLEPDRDGRIRVYLNNGVGVVQDGKLTRVWGTQRDITERKQAEVALRASLREKEALLKETHHRVKNNLQIISSLLNLQAAHIDDPDTLSIYRVSQDRVRSMALVHETLYRSGDLARIDLASYIESVCAHLYRSYGADPSRIQLDVQVADASLDLDHAIPCGLLINELVSNALKYAFPGERAGRIAVSLLAEADRTYTITISDNGIGLPEQFDLSQLTSLGLQLVADLTAQIHGTLLIERQDGTHFRINFPAPDLPRSSTHDERQNPHR